MRCVGDHLDTLLESPVPDLVQRQRQDNWNGKTGDELIEAYPERVKQDASEVEATEESAEVLEPHQRAAEDAEFRAEVLEGKLDAVHREVFEHDDECDGRQQQEIEIVVAYNLSQLPSVSCTQSHIADLING